MSESLIELGLLYDNELLPLVDRLLLLMSEMAVESDTLKTDDFRAKIEKLRRRAATCSSKNEMEAIGGESFALCNDYYKRAKTYLLEREAEFGQVIDVLREALGKVSGESASFNTKLMGTSERINRLTEIHDIRELKNRISQEVRELNRVVVEKQKQDEATYAKLSRKIEVLQTNLSRTREEASLDPLTRVANRGSFDRAIERWVNSYKDNKKPFVLGMLDLDNFKNINDTHGHQVGDRVLLSAAQCFGKHLRSTDFLARYGGEEFAVLLLNTELPQAEAKMVEILARVSSKTHDYKQEDEYREVRFTVSCGLAEFAPGESVEEFIRRADEALYQAKHTGKNRVVVAPKKQKGFWRSLMPSRDEN